MIWYPYEQMKTMKAPYKILDAEGVHLYTKDQKLIDSISSWWCMIHGYKNKEINEAMKNQIDQFSHVMLGGLTHEPVLKLSEKLKDFLPGDLDYCFFSDSGSVAVEVALKMALQFNINRGSGRKKLLSLTSSYHGDTFMCMKAGDDEDFHVRTAPFSVDDPDLRLQRNAGKLSDARLNQLDRFENVGGRCAAGVDNEARVLF